MNWRLYDRRTKISHEQNTSTLLLFSHINKMVTILYPKNLFSPFNRPNSYSLNTKNKAIVTPKSVNWKLKNGLYKIEHYYSISLISSLPGSLLFPHLKAASTCPQCTQSLHAAHRASHPTLDPTNRPQPTVRLAPPPWSRALTPHGGHELT
jgi:hypothetical protein